MANNRDMIMSATAKRLSVLVISIILAALSIVPIFSSHTSDSIYMVQDALDPLPKLLETIAGSNAKALNPYKLGYEAAGIGGMYFLYGSQARGLSDLDERIEYHPLYTTSVVIAVNGKGNSAGRIDGWKTLLESDAVVMFPHNAIESGRLTAIALARALGADEGDYSPAFEALGELNESNRLNSQDEYKYDGYNYMYYPENLLNYDAVVMWDYQAVMLQKMFPGWEIVYPEEGVFTIDCGFIVSENAKRNSVVQSTSTFFLSEEGENALANAGFCTFGNSNENQSSMNDAGIAGKYTEKDLGEWDYARLTYNPDYRRSVLSVKLNGPASLLERVGLQTFILLMFCITAHGILKKIPEGESRRAGFQSIVFAGLWLIMGLCKSFIINVNVARYLWFATYIPRHFLPLCWFAACHLTRFGKLPSKKLSVPLAFSAIFLSIFVLTNDIHRQVFSYAFENQITWHNHYSNQWGYFLSLFWSFSLILIGFAYIISDSKTRHRKRQIIYSSILFLILIIYQLLYIIGVRYFIDLDIPTTVAICILIFNYAAQREGFLGATLFELPLLRNSIYAVAIFDRSGSLVFKNETMASLGMDGRIKAGAMDFGDAGSEIVSGSRIYKRHDIPLKAGNTVLLEEITDLKDVERKLIEVNQKLEAVNEILSMKAMTAAEETRTMEKDRYRRQMDSLFHDKVSNLIEKIKSPEIMNDHTLDSLKETRLMTAICHRRLRFVIRSTENNGLILLKRIGEYTSGLLRDCERLGLDGIVVSAGEGFIIPEKVPQALEFSDVVCLFVLRLGDASVVFNYINEEKTVYLSALISAEENANIPEETSSLIYEALSGSAGHTGKNLIVGREDDSLSISMKIEKGGLET